MKQRTESIGILDEDGELVLIEYDENDNPVLQIEE